MRVIESNIQGWLFDSERPKNPRAEEGAALHDDSGVLGELEGSGKSYAKVPQLLQI